MPSAFSWLDHSDRDRRRMRDALDKLKETDTRDELGIGSIRDGFANLFFPGTSTIQTRARYFLMIPWACQGLEQKGLAEGFAKKLRIEETRVIEGLVNAGGDEEGVIGRRSGAATKRMASSVYWFGLSAWGIRRFPGSLEEYCRANEKRARGGLEELRDDDGNLIEGMGRHWHPYLPEVPGGFPGAVSFQLSAVEARYLTERIRFSVPSSLLAFLVEHARSLDGEFPWEHPQVSEFPEAVRSALAHAQCFAEAMNSASLLYNLMLAEEMPEGPPRTERVEDFRDRLSKLRESLRARDRALGEWDRSAFWHLVEGIANLRPPTRTFVNDWLALEPWARPADFVDAPAVRALIRDRELQLKGKARARLGNPGAIDNWNGEAGTAMLEYRWIAAQRILRDILSVEVE